MAAETGRNRNLPTSKDVAALAGVAQSTVSYVMSGKRSVKEETRLRVEDAMRELTYQPNAGARALRGSRSDVIALVVHLGADADLEETAPYIESVVDEARRRDFEVVLSTIDEGPAAIERLARRRISDAFVLMDIRTEDDRIATAASLGRPVVLFGRPNNAQGLDAVDFDSRQAAELLVDELADTGHQHVVVVNDGVPGQDGQFAFIEEFWEGARTRAQERGLHPEILYRDRDGWAGIEDIADRVLRHRDGRLGLVARTPRMTEWLLQLLRLNSLVPGRDVSIVSMCTDARAESFEPAVTNVAPETKELCKRAMSILFDRLDGADGPAVMELVEPRRLTRRATTADFR